jgi:CRISPR-associated endonuclease Csn1
LFFAIYVDAKGKRSYDTIPLNIVIERQKQGEKPVPETNDAGNSIYFEKLSKEQRKRIYKIVSFTGNRLYGVPYSVAKPIVDKVEFTQLNKLESSLEKLSLKDFSIKLKVDRLGNIKSYL